jgi:hypothetical protein
MKESFDFGNPSDESLSMWPPEEHLPGFHGFAYDLHRVGALIGGDIAACLTITRNVLSLYNNCLNLYRKHLL